MSPPPSHKSHQTGKPEANGKNLGPLYGFLLPVWKVTRVSSDASPGACASGPGVPTGAHTVYLAMNRFRVLKHRTADFEAMWLGRDSHLAGVDGFVEFRLLRGPEHDDHVLYASHTFWRDEEAFRAWTRSEAFRRAHAGAGQRDGEPMTAGGPVFEGFSTLQAIGAARDG